MWNRECNPNRELIDLVSTHFHLFIMGLITMNDFIEFPSHITSIIKRELVCGVGINDAERVSYNDANGRRIACPYYQKWHSMIERCYSSTTAKNHTYINCSVCDEWLTFSKFKSWMKTQKWEGLHLDKDIISADNKVYSPLKCHFVSQSLNNLFCTHTASKGLYPVGVCWDKSKNKFKAAITINTKDKFLGRFNTPEEAEIVYIKAKIEYIINLSQNEIPIIKAGLLRHAEKLKTKLC